MILSHDCVSALGNWLIIASACLLGAMSPGPSLIVVLSQSFNNGRLFAIITALFHGFGVGIYAALSIVGWNFLLTEQPIIIGAFQWTGSGYLLWLGIQILRHSGNEGNANATSQTRLHTLNPALLGLLTALVNPKVLLFFFALFSQLVPEDSSLGLKLLYVLTAAVIDAGWYTGIAWLGSHKLAMKRLMRHTHWIERSFAILLIVLALKIVVVG